MKENENAVSPVVGVMLMLVVTIIIAAVVSAFAGGMSSETSKAPQVTIRAIYSQTDGMKIEHLGGDPIATTTTTVIVKPSKTFGNAEHVISIVNKTIITDESGDPWVTEYGMSKAKAFRPGDTHYIKPPYHEHEYLQPGVTSTYRFDTEDFIGRTFWLEFTDESGKVFAKTEVVIES